MLNAAYDQNRQVSQAFSAKIMETGEAARKMNERLAAAEFRCTALERQIFDTIAAECAGKGNVLRFEDGLTPLAVRELADRIAAVCGGIAVVFSGSDGQFNICLVNHSGDVKELGSAMNKALNGRGGGKQGIFQGSVKANKADIIAFFQGFSM